MAETASGEVETETVRTDLLHERARLRGVAIRQRIAWLEEQRHALGLRRNRSLRPLEPSGGGGSIARVDPGGSASVSMVVEIMRPVILLFDPHEDSRNALWEILSESGFSVVSARDDADCRRAAREQRPRLIVYDVRTPTSASLNLLEELRTTAATEHIPVLLVTGAIAEEHRTRARSVGCAGYLEKPCSPERLLREIRRIIAALPPLEVLQRPAAPPPLRGSALGVGLDIAAPGVTERQD